MDVVSFIIAEVEWLALSLQQASWKGLYLVMKSKRSGFPSGFALGPIVGWYRSMTGALWSCSYIESADRQRL